MSIMVEGKLNNWVHAVVLSPACCASSVRTQVAVICRLALLSTSAENTMLHRDARKAKNELSSNNSKKTQKKIRQRSSCTCAHKSWIQWKACSLSTTCWKLKSQHSIMTGTHSQKVQVRLKKENTHPTLTYDTNCYLPFSEDGRGFTDWMNFCTTSNNVLLWEHCRQKSLNTWSFWLRL